jgi:hypothetical protein
LEFERSKIVNPGLKEYLNFYGKLNGIENAEDYAHTNYDVGMLSK